MALVERDLEGEAAWRREEIDQHCDRPVIEREAQEFEPSRFLRAGDRLPEEGKLGRLRSERRAGAPLPARCFQREEFVAAARRFFGRAGARDGHLASLAQPGGEAGQLLALLLAHRLLV